MGKISNLTNIFRMVWNHQPEHPPGHDMALPEVGRFQEAEEKRPEEAAWSLEGPRDILVQKMRVFQEIFPLKKRWNFYGIFR